VDMVKFNLPYFIFIFAIFLVIETDFLETETSTQNSDEETVAGLVPKEKNISNAMVVHNYPQFQFEKGKHLKCKYS
jgi:hypothetical protein